MDWWGCWAVGGVNRARVKAGSLLEGHVGEWTSRGSKAGGAGGGGGDAGGGGGGGELWSGIGRGRGGRRWA
jgi:hypothetical protein